MLDVVVVLLIDGVGVSGAVHALNSDSGDAGGGLVGAHKIV